MQKLLDQDAGRRGREDARRIEPAGRRPQRCRSSTRPRTTRRCRGSRRTSTSRSRTWRRSPTRSSTRTSCRSRTSTRRSSTVRSTRSCRPCSPTRTPNIDKLLQHRGHEHPGADRRRQVTSSCEAWRGVGAPRQPSAASGELRTAQEKGRSMTAIDRPRTTSRRVVRRNPAHLAPGRRPQHTRLPPPDAGDLRGLLVVADRAGRRHELPAHQPRHDADLGRLGQLRRRSSMTRCSGRPSATRHSSLCWRSSSATRSR